MELPLPFPSLMLKLPAVLQKTARNLFSNACHTYSTIIFPHSTNQLQAGNAMIRRGMSSGALTSIFFLWHSNFKVQLCPYLCVNCCRKFKQVIQQHLVKGCQLRRDTIKDTHLRTEQQHKTLALP